MSSWNLERRFRIPVIEQPLDTATLMLGSDKFHGYHHKSDRITRCHSLLHSA